jgi:hypothetical protein
MKGKGVVYESRKENSCTEDAIIDPGITRPERTRRIQAERIKVLFPDNEVYSG